MEEEFEEDVVEEALEPNCLVAGGGEDVFKMDEEPGVVVVVVAGAVATAETDAGRTLWGNPGNLALGLPPVDAPG